MSKVTVRGENLKEDWVELLIRADGVDVADLYNFQLNDEVVVLSKEIYERLKGAYLREGGL